MTIPDKIFIIPYRDRESDKNKFLQHMKYVLEDIPDTEYEIYFAHQCDSRPFNRGSMKNIGFLAIKTKYPDHYKDITFIFNDVDTMPRYKNQIDYNTSLGTIRHFYGFDFALGGFFSIKGADFENINGFPGYWGWGLEDNEIYHRALAGNLIVDRSNFFKIGSQEIIHLHDSPLRLTNNSDPTRYRHRHTDGINCIKLLNYTIDNDFITTRHFINSINPSNDKFYYKNIQTDTRLYENYLERQSKKSGNKKWNMTNFFE